MDDVSVCSYLAPVALVEHCTRRTSAKAATPGSDNVGTRDREDVAALLRWLAERDEFDTHDAWVAAGMAIKLDFGPDGLDLWQITHDDTVTSDVEQSKWDSFATEPSPNSVTLNSLLSRAHKLGWRGTVRKSTSSMFGTASHVARMATAAGASLPLPGNGGIGSIPLLDSQRTIASLGQPIVDDFLASTRDAPFRPTATEYPQLPDLMAEHSLYTPLRSAVDRIIAMAEGGGARSFRIARVLDALAVLHAVHAPTFDAVCQRIRACGGVVPEGKLDAAVKRFEWGVRREQRTNAGFRTDLKGNPEKENTDNVLVFLRTIGVEVRWNLWKVQVEVRDVKGEEWEPLTDHVFGGLLVTANSGHFNYHPSETLFRRTLISLARENMYDPVIARVDALAAAWDGQPRLAIWLTAACGVPCDPYHQAVGKNIIGGMVKRARHPGCKHDETAILISPVQGTGKSETCKILALEPTWHTDSFKFDGSPQNSIPQLFGKWIIELSELAGMARKELEHVKGFLSAQSDNFTKKYEAFAADHPRRCIFIGTSNDKAPLMDATGNRRFLPVQVVGEINLDWLRANVEQIIGEAAHREAAGETFEIPRSLWGEAAKRQEAARAMSSVEELCSKWFDREEGFYVTSTDVGHALRLSGQSQYVKYAVFMERLGWRSENMTVPAIGKKARIWIKHSTNNLTDCARLEPSQASTSAPVEMRAIVRHVGAPPLAPNAPAGAALPLPPIPVR